MLQLGLIPSHFSFLLLHTMHARRFGFGTLEFPPVGAASSADPGRRVDWPWGLGSETMMVSEAASEDGDMDTGSRGVGSQFPGRGGRGKGAGCDLVETLFDSGVAAVDRCGLGM